MGHDETAAFRPWREMRGEVEPVNLSGGLIVQLGLVTNEIKSCPTRQGCLNHADLTHGGHHEFNLPLPTTAPCATASGRRIPKSTSRRSPIQSRD